MQKFHGFFGSEVDVEREFQEPEVLDYDILLAYYHNEDYGCDGSAYVLAMKDGKLFEVEGGHCSCYGLEGQWKPSEVSVAYLLMRLERGGFPVDCDLVRQVIESL